MSVYIQGKEAASVDFLGKNAFAIYQPYNREARTANAYNISYNSLGDGLADGEVPGGAEIYKKKYENLSGWTAISNATDLTEKVFRTITSGNFYLTNDITLSYSQSLATNEECVFSGILDGCGYTISVTSATTWQAEMKNETNYGVLTGVLKGEIKNVNINVIDSYYQQGPHGNNNNSIKAPMAHGVIAHTCNGGKLTNVKVKYADSDDSGMIGPRLGGTTLRIGLIFGKSWAASIKSLTVELASDLAFWTRSGSGTNNLYYGIISGSVESGITAITNLTIRGSHNFRQTGYDKYGKLAIGAIVGKIETGSLVVDGLDLGEWIGGITTKASSNNTGLYLGSGSTSATISNVFYSNNASNAYSTTGGGKWTAGDNRAFAPINTPQKYAIDRQYFGFCHSEGNLDKVWIGEIGKWNAVTGYYVKDIIINSTDKWYLNNLCRPTENNFIPVISKAAITGDITGYELGYYGYISNEKVSGGRKIYYKNGTQTYTDDLPATVPSYDAYEIKTIDGAEYTLIKNTNKNYYN